MKNPFVVEQLEPRILLSGDILPVLLPLLESRQSANTTSDYILEETPGSVISQVTEGDVVTAACTVVANGGTGGITSADLMHPFEAAEPMSDEAGGQSPLIADFSSDYSFTDQEWDALQDGWRHLSSLIGETLTADGFISGIPFVDNGGKLYGNSEELTNLLQRPVADYGSFFGENGNGKSVDGLLNAFSDAWTEGNLVALGKILGGYDATKQEERCDLVTPRREGDTASLFLQNLLIDDGTLDLSRFGADVTCLFDATGTLTLGSGAWSFTDGVLHFEDNELSLTLHDVNNLIGASGNDTYVFVGSLPVSITDSSGDDNLFVLGGSATTWTIDGKNEGSVGELGFQGIENLIGGVDNQDTFVFNEGGSLAGKVDGSAAGFDTLVLNGGSYTTVTYTAFSPQSGTIARDGDVISYDGLEPLVDNTSTVNRIIGLSNSSDTDARLFSELNGSLTVSGSTFESVNFIKPSESLTIRGLDGTDTVTISSLNLGSTRLTIEAENIFLP
ncbi:MAG: LEPR-XLL domain-containing protein, partial [Chlorobium sp.]